MPSTKLVHRAAALSLPLLALSAAHARADEDPSPRTPEAAELTHVPRANSKTVGLTSADVLSPELRQAVVAQGSNPLENPANVTLPGGASASLSYYGFDGDGPLVPAPGDLPSASHKVEASKSEPDKNTYLVLPHQVGPDASYDYGTHFLYQGHEGGQSGLITRVNLDADAQHRVTLLATSEVSGALLPTFDGSTWNPFAGRLLFSAESLNTGGLWQATLDFPSKVEPLHGSFGHGGFEGIQTDSDGNVWVVEDVGGPTGTINAHSKQPNSFVYRFVPVHKHDLGHGKLQALQVVSLRDGQPIVFHAGQADADATSPDLGDMHTYGKVLDTRWVTIHDTEVDGTAPFNANALAKTHLATPFKRPENGQFRPGTGFREFYFSETGDTDNRSEVGAALGGFGAVFKLSQTSPSAAVGKLSPFYVSDVAHTGFDNVAFWDADHVVFVEDAGDTLHTQRNALDSAFMFDVRKNYGDPTHQPVRILAEGRDPLATLDSAFSGLAGFQNDGDNEITGIHVSDGDPSARGLLGAKAPRPFRSGWRAFYTQQHGENTTWEILPTPGYRLVHR